MEKIEEKESPWTAWERPAREGRMAEAIMAYVRGYDFVTFVELRRLLAPFFEVDGEEAIIARDNPNVIFWLGMSESLSKVVRDLLDRKELYFHPADVLSYMIDGGGLRLPLVKSRRSYKTPRWCPVCLRAVPL